MLSLRGMGRMIGEELYLAPGEAACCAGGLLHNVAVARSVIYENMVFGFAMSIVSISSLLNPSSSNIGTNRSNR